jgi:putative transcriptional regulator
MSTEKYRVFDHPLPPGRVDYERLRATTDEDIARQIAEDPDTAPDMGNVTDWRVVRNPPVPDVRQIREKLGLSQADFADRFGLSFRTVQEWEQGRAVPDRPARVLLKVIEHSPNAVTRALRAS